MNNQSYVEGFRGKDRQWYYRLVSGNGRTLATSEGYTRKASLIRAVNAFYDAAQRFEFRWC